MSHIPNSAMPHAVDPETAEEFEKEHEDEQPSRGERARAMFREHPRKSAAAGAALIAGIAAAAAAPFLANRKKAAEPKAKRAAPAKKKAAAPAKTRAATSTKAKAAPKAKAPTKRKPAAKRTTTTRSRAKKPS